MLLQSIKIKNFKSFGNTEQEIVLNTKNGELILLKGSNGNGKSAIGDSLDFNLFKKVKGRNKKTVTLSSLPNRINSELLTTVEFISNGTRVKVVRGITPNILELWENDVLNDRAGKANIDKEIEKYIGMDFEAFKSFISMSISDFKNFLSLSNEEKKLLLDRLFNLETINVLNDILKELVKNNKSDISVVEKEIETLDESIKSIKTSLEKTKEKLSKNIEDDITNIKNKITENKTPYTELKTKLDKISEKETSLKTSIDNLKNDIINTNSEIKRVAEDIELYNNSKCPTCKSDLTAEFHVNFKNDLVEKHIKLQEIKKELSEKYTNLNTSKTKLDTIKTGATSKFNDLKYALKNWQSELEKLQLELGDKSSSLDEFIQSIKEFETKKKTSREKKSDYENKKLYHKELSEVFSEDGVKKSIIRNIIKPINVFLNENIKVMNIPFEIELNENFDASIKHFGLEIDPETLSLGETKRCNISILLAYMMLIRTKRAINILFLDEVFSSIDVDGINDILKLLKRFANQYNINIFLVHHSHLDSSYFDRIINVKKDIFTHLEEYKDF
jgi:DNA repair protein SbcC/Rad50